MHELRTGRLLIAGSLVLLATALLPGVAAAQEPTGRVASLCAALQALDGQDGIRLGLVVEDLATGDRCGIGADGQFRSASLYKLVVLAEAFRQIEAGTFSLDEAITIEPRHAIDDPPELRLTSTVFRQADEAIRRMIQSSANADALALRERLGIEAVDGSPPSLGMESTRLGLEFVTTPDDIAHFYRLLYAGALVSPAASTAMLEILQGQLIVDMIPRGLPEGIEVAHKTGTLLDHLHDAGIVYAPGGDFTLVALTEHPGDLGAAATLIQQVAALVYERYRLPLSAEPLLPAGLVESEDAPEIAPEVLAALGEPSGDAAPAADAAIDEDVTSSEEGGSGFELPSLPSIPVGVNVFSVSVLTIAAALLGVFSYGIRLRRTQGLAYNREAIDAVAGGGEGTAAVRLGIRKNESDELEEELDEFEGAALPASESFSEIELQPVMPSPRLERMAHFFGSQQQLLDAIKQQHEEEIRPLNTLLIRQGETQQRLLANLESRLRPLNEYADGEEANLDALEQRMIEQGPDFIQRSFAEYLEAQRARIADTRDQIDEQRLPLLRYGEEQRDAIEVALGRFDADVEALELNLAEQRKLLMRMLDAMRSDSFVAVKRFLEAREAAMAELAAAGITDPAQIGHSVQNLRDAVDAMASQSVHIQSVLEATDSSDEQLVAAAPNGPHALPQMSSFDTALAELESAEQTVGETA